jgi:CRP-like cAMP-binding protein
MIAAPRAPAAPRNRILVDLAVIAPAESAWLARKLESVALVVGDIVAPAGAAFAHVYFPETAVFSAIHRMSDGAAIEVGTIGNEGMVGIAVLLDAETSVNETVVQIPGTAVRVAARWFADRLDARPELRHLLRRYTDAYLTQVAQTAACNRVHGIEARCARWLLMTHDRVGETDQFLLTQEYLAIMLGVRRSSVSVAASALRDAGLIRYSRGAIRVMDRPGLEGAACECYGVVRRHFDRLFA